ncbi:jg8099 [Pararge aegeria aegeria]|uniref:Jg8099 protein n=1 Tax=Pararge aegeria aegeria TaxID=348720 RepID=A0A8S4QW16_9NEOP|nr:jg8099 [Pararge aegeria aegeria]
MRLFVIAIVWICNFFVATFSDNALLKLFKFSFLYGLFSTAFVLIFLMFSTKYTTKAFYDIMNIRDGFNVAMNHLHYYITESAFQTAGRVTTNRQT